MAPERGPRADKVYDFEISPKLLMVGRERVEIGVKLVRRRGHVAFDEATDSISLRSRDGTRTVKPVPGSTEVRGDRLTATIELVDKSMVGYWDIVIDRADGRIPPIPFAVRVVDRVRIALTFDDGPTSRWSSSKAILDRLSLEEIKAAFFVLTTSDWLYFCRQAKADSDEGFDILVREVREGHVLGCHWGGRYETQHATHPGRTLKAPYASYGDLFDDVVGPDGCALESDLLQCMRTIEKAQAVAGKLRPVEFVRPPLWNYRTGLANSLPTYADLGLKMILTDALARDGGYGSVPFCYPKGYLITGGIAKAIAEGHAEVVITAHDSNLWTALRFDTLLADIRRKMSVLEYDEGTEWCFVSDTDELVAILRSKRRFRSDIDLAMPDTTHGLESSDEVVSRTGQAAPSSAAQTDGER
jgi:peptidoglycan/xylan/chitin deacetylase (PgdA/CDA1 family)